MRKAIVAVGIVVLLGCGVGVDEGPLAGEAVGKAQGLDSTVPAEVQSQILTLTAAAAPQLEVASPLPQNPLDQRQQALGRYATGMGPSGCTGK